MAGRIRQAWGSLKHWLVPPQHGWLERADKVYLSELGVVSKRRRHLATGQPEIAASRKWPPETPLDTIGLCLSGGGIRSAAFCLGALQALDAKKITAGAAGGSTSVFSFVDYLSTVSGGGYIGSALSARMKGSGVFPFESRLGHEEPNDLKGIRDRSNYLFPPRDWALAKNLSIYLRGLFANVLRVASWLFVLAAVTLCVKPKLGDAGPLSSVPAALVSWASAWLGVALSTTNFAYTANLSVLFLLFLFAWAIWRSMPQAGRESEVNGGMTWVGYVLLLLLVAVAFVELQPVLIEFVVHYTATKARLVSLGALATAGGVIGFFRGWLQKLADAVINSPGWKANFTRVLFAVLALPVPLLVWAAYLVLCAHGYEQDLTAKPSFAVWYFWIGVVLFVLLVPLSANANSLHRLYRERLNSAFFRSGGIGASIASAVAPVSTIRVPRLSQLLSTSGPYHLINTSINLEGSRYLNERGRNADVFVFSPKYVGSRATGYVPTATFEAACRDLDLGTAMAISGAAVSPDMGASTLRWLAPTLAFLNVRLGYWMRNPLKFSQPTGGASATPPTGFVARVRGTWNSHVRDAFPWRIVKWIGRHAGGYFFQEAFGLLNERRAEVYLTDGGHIDDLGLYELLRRRCRLIIVVDGEQDGPLRFPSFVSLQRYARIDRGIRIDVPWQAIRARSLATSQALADGGKVEAYPGPHCALGVIQYTANKDDDGILLYVKSSLSGDESDYITDYALRNNAFPHESTVDQFFTEEQFEVYRALGFHALFGVLSGTDCLPVQPDSPPVDHKGAEPPAPLHKITDDVPRLNALRAAIGLPEPQPSARSSPKPEPEAMTGP